jgi:hypothetical protein
LSTATWLLRSYTCEEINGYHGVPIGDELFPDYFKFTTVRNPYTRAQSIYSWVMKQHKTLYPDLPAMGWRTFLQWLVNGMPGYEDENKVMLLPQHQFLEGVKLAKIFRFEEIPKCFAELPFSDKRLNQFPHSNEGTVGKPALTPSTKCLIRQWAGPDFKMYGYTGCK